jgi:L-seryl-tRNA(Ser) seleniumtransferase
MEYLSLTNKYPKLMKINRRNLLKRLSATPILGALASPALSVLPSTILANTPSDYQRDLFKELGLRTFINCAGPFTSMTGCLMPKEVLETIEVTGRQYVDLDTLQERVGERIAELLECEAAVVSSGCFGAMSIAAAGAIAGMDKNIVDQLPDTSGLKNEVILQESHMGGYVRAVTNIGAKLVLIKTPDDLKKAVNKRTSMMWFLNKYNHKGEINDEQWVALGKKYQIPTLNDCASDIPPMDNLFKYTKMGFDMVTFSGGKGLRGPQSAGLLIGKKKYIEAAKLHTPPRTNVGRAMKVNKEEILGMLVALEIYLAKDHEQEWKMWERQVKHIQDAANSVKGVTTEVFLPEIANEVPTLRIDWDHKKLDVKPQEVREKLRLGHPSILTWPTDETLQITTWMMEPGQERVVAHRVKQVLEEFIGNN